MNALDMESSSHYSTSAHAADQLPAEVESGHDDRGGAAARAVRGRAGMESPSAARDGFESLLESIYASIAASPQGGASRAPPGVEPRDVLDDIYKRHET